MPNPLTNESRKVANFKRALKERWPDIDDTTLFDTVDGMTEFTELLSWTVRRVGEEQASSAALKQYIDELSARKAATDTRVARMKDMIAEAMETAGEKTIRLPEATLSMRAGQAKLIVDEALIPKGFFYEYTEWRIDKTKIKDALARHEGVSGASMSNPTPILTIRRK
jgi:hypothetical protein